LPAPAVPEPPVQPAMAEPPPAQPYAIEPPSVPDVPPAPPTLGADVHAKVAEAADELRQMAGGEISSDLMQAIMDKVEKIAWEVIPQIAEVVVQERIRKLESGG